MRPLLQLTQGKVFTLTKITERPTKGLLWFDYCGFSTKVKKNEEHPNHRSWKIF